MEYTQADLDELRVLVKLMEAGKHEKIDAGAAAKFAALHWIEQTSDAPPRFEVTELGRQRLEPR